ncbi:TdeIII family type II restriction endonuclease [Bacillus toyonensis]|uniref:TdeIII family type II restriction endonuclease n=1 Tax=Bacillus toyonensis TaxID=155322 RepID=UPI00211D98DC|nr:TdeIII family type II restriction endonuclease [Bacillus toyonensis]
MKRRLKDASNMPNWSREINEVLALTNPRFEAITIKSDLYICRQDGSEEFYFFRGVKLNRDQVTGVKEDILKLNAVNNEYKTYFALPYNPSGQDGGYKKAHGLPYTI